jgi:hypothetical protein
VFRGGSSSTFNRNEDPAHEQDEPALLAAKDRPDRNPAPEAPGRARRHRERTWASPAVARRDKM